MCPEKKLTRGPEQYVSLIVAGAAGVAGAAFSNTRFTILLLNANFLISSLDLLLNNFLEWPRLPL